MPETNAAAIRTLDFDERETLRWADGALGIEPRQPALDRLFAAGLVTTDDAIVLSRHAGVHY
jgi:hypothetical protein